MAAGRPFLPAKPRIGITFRPRRARRPAALWRCLLQTGFNSSTTNPLGREEMPQARALTAPDIRGARLGAVRRVPRRMAAAVGYTDRRGEI